ncbi:radical SAM domain protein [Sulfurimonas gotlandica GD1]|uniref:S-adenosylmethionine-dependent nucleotide dehydratase n=1 Tax=Sulfurimonas gotlandica (strain DSM 19862 / JCM 16533 / GD1) TaxID=929558 RepID=B6BKZ8_SULGG|nr:viperin family antiviral radical SAM protein [Sulfurimonas gotlandica]EDZ61970.1 radical SAM domain protein [Sulfurimonas gotlandica GD1]EHP28730.1 radical SAM domain protein [Sulfurimonas gotlandica GD1]
MNEITINWHIIQQCNYKCTYCFAKYKRSFEKEIQVSKKDIEVLLNKVYSFFSQEYKGTVVRLNIAGGEPTLSRNIDFIIKKAYEIGFKVSLISNSSKITNRFIESNAKYLSMFAISIDSIEKSTNLNIGRSYKNEILDVSRIIKSIEQFRKINKNIQIKINTVVNEHNYQEYLGHFIDLINPIKWKVFQALSMDKDIEYCSIEQFNVFLDKHEGIDSKIYIESNDDMKDSYIMIDPHGRFYQNTNITYNYSDSILNSSVADAFQSIEFNLNKFNKRYKNEI